MIAGGKQTKGVKAAGSDRAGAPGAFLTRYANKAGGGIGPLAGLTVAVKDNICVAGEPFTAGIPLFADRRAEADAAVVVQLKSAGATICGVTVTDAGGFGVLTPAVANPALPGRSAGGSSGGSAAAVAAGQADIGLGTDTGGSCRIPAACCGILGFKPTNGMVPTVGVWPLAPSFDTIGVMASHFEILSKAMAVLLGWPERDQLPRIVKLGIDPSRIKLAESGLVDAFDRFSVFLDHADVELHAVDLPDAALTLRTHGTIVLAEANKFYREAVPDIDHEMLPAVARLALEAASKLHDDDVVEAYADAIAIGASMSRIFAECDAVIGLTLAASPPRPDVRRIKVRDREMSVGAAMMLETCLANVIGGPALAMPSGAGDDRFVSVQIAGARGTDRRVFEIGQRIASRLYAVSI